MNKLLHADDTVLLGDSKKNIQRSLYEFDKVCERRKLSKSQIREHLNSSLISTRRGRVSGSDCRQEWRGLGRYVE